MAAWPPSEVALVRGADGHVHHRGTLEHAYWRALALCSGVLGLCPVRGWPSRCEPFSTSAACAAFLVGVLIESFNVAISTQFHPGGHTLAMALLLFSLHVVVLQAALRRRRALADTNECLRLYCAHRTPPARAPAATMLLALLLPLKMVMYLFDVLAFLPKYSARKDRTLALLSSGLFLVRQLQWTGAFCIMLHPMLVLGSLAGDLSHGCSWLVQERMALAPCKRIKDARPYDKAQAWRRLRLEQQMLYDIYIANYVVHQEIILLVIVITLTTPPIYLANSILEILNSDVSPATLLAAFVGLNYFVDIGVFSFISQWFFFESARSKAVLYGFLVQADPRQIEENSEISMFITQIERQTMCSVWGLFQIDTNFTLGILLAATTYVALLCQIGATFYN